MSTTSSSSTSGRKRPAMEAAVSPSPTKSRSKISRRQDHPSDVPSLDPASKEKFAESPSSTFFQSAFGSSGCGAPAIGFRRPIARSYDRLIREGGSKGNPKRSTVDMSKNNSVTGDAKNNAAVRGNVLQSSESSCGGPVLDAASDRKSTTEEAVGKASKLSLNSSSSSYSSDVSSDDSDSTPSSSSDGYSEKSVCSSPHSSTTHSLFLQFEQQFSPSSHRVDRRTEPESIQNPTLDLFSKLLFRNFDEEDDEESYRMLRIREREDAVVVHDYAKEYGHMIAVQRIVMVNWMGEHSSLMKLPTENLFLGVSLMDRFLSRGYFKSERNLQLLGVACITLAAHVEGNQRDKCKRHIFYEVGNNCYSRNEVVAMEWLVQKILDYKCFPPTIYNFLWFYLEAAKADVNLEKLSKFLAIVALLDCEISAFKSSSAAASLVIFACIATKNDKSWVTVVETHIRTRNDDLLECFERLQRSIKRTWQK